jgi:hypothetical protein
VKKTAPRGLLWALHATEDPLSRALQRFFRQSLPRGAYPVARSKRTSRAPSPNTAWKRSSGCFVFWDLHRVTEQPETRSGEQTSENSNFGHLGEQASDLCASLGGGWHPMCNGPNMYGKLVALQREIGRRGAGGALRSGGPRLASSTRPHV